MSNSDAIAAVTTTLQNLIYQGMREDLGSGAVTALSLDKAREGITTNQVNLFLYHAQPNRARTNQHPNHQVKRHGDSHKSPLALDLYYLIVAYGEKDSEIHSHRLMGRVMSLLYDYPVLIPEDIERFTTSDLPQSDLHRQLGKIQITHLPLTFEAMSEVWQVLKAPYHVSAAYQVSAVLIDSSLPVKSPLPIIARGQGEGGGLVQLGMPPTLTELQLPNRQVSAQLGDRIRVKGQPLVGRELRFQLRHPRLPDPIILTPIRDRNQTDLMLVLPSVNEQVRDTWLAGFYTVCITEQQPNRAERTSNELPLAVAPIVTQVTPQQATSGTVNLQLSCIPQIQDGQRVVLLWGEQGVNAQAIDTPNDSRAPTTLNFHLNNVQPGVYVIRLRVDGVDSIPVDFSTVPWQFAANQQVRVLSR